MAITYLSGERIQGSSSTGATDTLGSAGDATSNDADLDTSNEKLGTGCLDFDGSEKIVANGLLNAMNTAGSISLWFNAAQDEDAILFAFCATGSNTKLEIATQTTDTISCQLKISGTQQWAVNSTSTYSNTGTWNHIVFTHNGTLPEIYINGTIASMNRSSTTDNTKWWTALRNAGANGIAIGSKAPLNGNTWNEFFEGKLDDIGIWDRALTSTEVGNLYNSGTGALATTVPSGLKVYYNCDSATVTNNAVLVDEKTTISNVPVGTRYEETDTRKIFRRKASSSSPNGTNNNATRVSAGHSSGQGANLGTYAWDFNGTNAYVDFGAYFSFERTDSFSYSFWVKSPEASFGIWYSSVEGSGGSSSGYQGIQLRNNYGTRDVELALTNHWMDNLIRCGFSDSDIYDGDWHMITITYDGTSLISGCNFYFDGSLATKSSGEDTLTGSIVPSTVHPALIGARNTPSGLADFTDLPFMDQFLIYEKELTSGEVTTLWNSGDGVATPNSTSLLGWYNFEQAVADGLTNQVTEKTWVERGTA